MGEQSNDDVPQCVYCMHWRQGSCTAYPAGVPYIILANKVNHRNPFPLDRHIHFRPYSLEADAKQRAIFTAQTTAAKPRRRFPFFWKRAE